MKKHLKRSDDHPFLEEQRVILDSADHLFTGKFPGNEEIVLREDVFILFGEDDHIHSLACQNFHSRENHRRCVGRFLRFQYFKGSPWMLVGVFGDDHGRKIPSGKSPPDAPRSCPTEQRTYARQEEREIRMKVVVHAHRAMIAIPRSKKSRKGVHCVLR